jgi:hypothetical protein
VWTLVMYLGLGAVPAILAHLSSSTRDTWWTAVTQLFTRGAVQAR